MFGQLLSAVLDDQWKRLRSIVTPTFSSGSLRRIKPRIDETVQNLLNNFEIAVGEAPDVDVKRLFGSYTMDTIVQVFYAFTHNFSAVFTLFLLNRWHSGRALTLLMIR